MRSHAPAEQNATGGGAPNLGHEVRRHLVPTSVTPLLESQISPCGMMKSVELHPASSLLCAAHRGRGQAVVFPAHHQRGEDWRAAGPAPPSLCRRGAVGGFALAEGADVAVHHHPDALRALHLLLDRQAADGGLEDLLAEVAVGHGAVEAADGPDARGEGLHLQ